MGHNLLAQIRLIFAGFVLVLAVIAGLFISHHLSVAQFVASIGLVVAAGAAILTRFLLQMRRLAPLEDPFQSPSTNVLRRRSRITAISLAVIVVCFSLTLWETRNRSKSSCIVAIAIGLIFTIDSVRSLRRDHAKRKQLEHRRIT